jgi:hypothetical protein
MSQYQDTLSTMVARVLQAKPNAQQSEVVRMLNGRIRQAINSKVYWADLLVRRIISFPAPYTGQSDVGGAGTVSYTFNSATVTGSSTTWPVSDLVNTTSTTPVNDIGYVQITPASMTGIKPDMLLYCDATGTPETIAVVETTTTSFWAKFTLTHTVNFTMTASSFAGRQLYTGSTTPIYTILSVQTATSLTLDNVWGEPSQSAQSYSIQQIYQTIDPNLKVILDVWDHKVGRKLEIYVPLEVVNWTDPQRTATGDPLAVVQHSPSPAGNMQYEIWPFPTVSRQLACLCSLQWPTLKMPFDRPPYFIDPNLFVIGAIADALRIKNLRNVSDQDPYYDPNLAMQYEQMYRIQLEECVNSDQAKAQRAYTHSWENILAAGGANFWQQHDVDVNNWTL